MNQLQFPSLPSFVLFDPGQNIMDAFGVSQTRSGAAKHATSGACRPQIILIADVPLLKLLEQLKWPFCHQMSARVKRVSLLTDRAAAQLLFPLCFCPSATARIPDGPSTVDLKTQPQICLCELCASLKGRWAKELPQLLRPIAPALNYCERATAGEASIQKEEDDLCLNSNPKGTLTWEQMHTVKRTEPTHT